MLLAADAFGSVLTAGLTALAQERGVDAVRVDAVKVPHHGSRANVSQAFVRAVPGAALPRLDERRHLPPPRRRGDRPDRRGRAGRGDAVVQLPHPAHGAMGRRRLRREHRYDVRYPTDDTTGVVLELPAQP